MILHLTVREHRAAVSSLPPGWWYADLGDAELGGAVLEVGATTSPDAWLAAIRPSVAACEVVDVAWTANPDLFGGAVPRGWEDAMVALSNRAASLWALSEEPARWALGELRSVWSAACPQHGADDLRAAADWLDHHRAAAGGGRGSALLPDPLVLPALEPEVTARLAHVHVVRLRGRGPERESALLRRLAEEGAAR